MTQQMIYTLSDDQIDQVSGGASATPQGSSTGGSAGTGMTWTRFRDHANKQIQELNTISE